MMRDSEAAPTPKAKGEPQAEGTKRKNADFLADEFGTTEAEAADLVADNAADRERLEQHEYAHQRDKDPLEGVPTPKSPNRTPDERIGHHMQKTVRHEDDEDAS